MITWLLACTPLTDVRPPELREIAASPERTRAGRARLRAAAEASGLEAWRGVQRIEATLYDEWPGTTSFMNPWPSSDTTMRLILRPGTMSSSARFLSGPKEGWTWGIEGGQPFRIEPAGGRTEVDDDTIRFMLPTVHYLVDLPFRIGEAEHVLDVGEREIGGETFHVVYATWGSVAPNRDYDQFLLYISDTSGRIEKAEYTFREVGAFLSAASHFDEGREIDGVWVPHRITVNGSATNAASEGVIHALHLSDVVLQR